LTLRGGLHVFSLRIHQIPFTRWVNVPYPSLKKWALPSTAIVLMFTSLSLPAFALAEKTNGATNGATQEDLPPFEELRTFTRAYDQVRKAYIDNISPTTLFEYAIKGMVNELDPHSTYLDKDAFAELQAMTSGEFVGVGIEVGMDEGAIRVITPLDDTPAQKAGIKAGDIIVRLDDQSMKGKNLNDATRILLGPKDSTLKITVQRKGMSEPLDILVTRDLVHVQSVKVNLLADNYLYLRIAQFQLNTGKDFTSRLSESLKQHPKTKGLILDLRNNPGGVFQAAIEVADAFMDNGLVVYTQGRLDSSNSNYSATPGDLSMGLPLVVLINSGSASASEIVAGALQDQKRAVIMGTRSFGKGSVQTVIPISEDRAIKLTTALYFTPNGHSIQARGIEPDVKFENPATGLELKTPTTEADLSGHIPSKDGSEINTKMRDRELPLNNDLSKDLQVLEAVNLLKGFHPSPKAASTSELPDINKPMPAQK
jgi:carboxyl-terminal processing protease